ncbi:MAG TPA: PIG-L family deacetylase [Terracidiphilus sp.]|nr:PIG-L family deacetylase [Terracidiphilus sp.]
MTVTKWILAMLVLATSPGSALAQSTTAPALLAPDSRYKADVLLVVAHPDDDVVIGAYLARIALDEHKRVAVVYCTNGDGGGNSVGYVAGHALGQIREIEARRALAAWGIHNVWFLPGHDTPGQNVLRSLDHWNHGLALDEVVRLVRITRPDVILTWLPDRVVGENHEDHQASGVLAVEAFDAAGDPTRFPEQISPALGNMANLTEAMLPWQPKKLYFFTDAFEDFGPYWHDPAVKSPYRKSFLDGTGPTYDATTISTSEHKSYGQLMAEQQSFYQTQEGDIGDRALKSGKFSEFEYPMHLIFGKSLVGGAATGDVFEGITPGSIPFARVRGYSVEQRDAVTFAIGDSWHFYSLFWKAHDLDRLATLIPIPEIQADPGERMTIPLSICNHTSVKTDVALKSTLPPEWKDDSKSTVFPVAPGECYQIGAQITPSNAEKTRWHEVTWTATSGSQTIGSVKVHVYVGQGGGLPQ